MYYYNTERLLPRNISELKGHINTYFSFPIPDYYYQTGINLISEDFTTKIESAANMPQMVGLELHVGTFMDNDPKKPQGPRVRIFPHIIHGNQVEGLFLEETIFTGGLNTGWTRIISSGGQVVLKHNQTFFRVRPIATIN